MLKSLKAQNTKHSCFWTNSKQITKVSCTHNKICLLTTFFSQTSKNVYWISDFCTLNRGLTFLGIQGKIIRGDEEHKCWQKTSFFFLESSARIHLMYLVHLAKLVLEVSIEKQNYQNKYPRYCVLPVDELVVGKMNIFLMIVFMMRCSVSFIKIN